ncbi:esterase-like activity of phytase family protein [Nocardia sp. 2]|uniref:Esterase-like activity of phytase family protein n=1 Tax=Nocardia acididurans TaxID=2802282 RepID=A0ABS1MA72_9NOCA|nr:esterase-like activity of phytase family protein [Nocardia acididurans]MBL1077050.1 esterase-like activity of phytase family protein [Nocardia acididurans]
MARPGYACLLALSALAVSTVPAHADPAGVRLLGEQVIAHGVDFQGTTVGGLSGIDYVARTGEYVLLSDDRSAKNPARFYTARIPLDGNGLGPVTFTATHALRAADDATYPANSVDPEEIRVDPWTGDYYWTQEGDRTDTVLADPSVRIARPDGGFAGELPIPGNERMRPDSGPRRNGVLEAATFAAGGTLFVTAVESSLLQDGPEATADTGATTRITVQARFGPLLAQYAYPLEPVFAPGAGGNGVASLLAVDSLEPTEYLVLERAFVEGVGNKIRIYEIDTSAATNILDAPATGARPVTKRLLVDLADLGLPAIDNLEGMTWGPNLPSGERTLLLVSDDNFADRQLTQLIVLAVR